jgi:FkbM family methyltransferase
MTKVLGIACFCLLSLTNASSSAAECEAAEETAKPGHALLQAKSQRSVAVNEPTSPPFLLIKEGDHPILATTAELNNAGMDTVTGTCCELEMETYIRKILKTKGLDVCDEAAMLKMAKQYTTCQVGSISYSTLEAHIAAARATNQCKMVAPTGLCPAAAEPACADAAAPGIMASHRRRACTPSMKRASESDSSCPLPEGAAWCQVRLKNLQPFWMAVYDWSFKSDWVSRNVCQAGFWDQNDPSGEFGTPGRALDIGGNMGYFTFVLAHAGWTVTTFEPMAPNLAMMNASLCRNPELASRVTVMPFGLGPKSQQCDMVSPSSNLGDGHVQCGDDVASGFSNDPTKVNYIAHYDVVKVGEFSIRRLDELLKNASIDKVDFVKIDVEGYESQVLEGAPNFLAEYHPRLFKLEVWNNSFGFNGSYFLDQFGRAGYNFFKDSKCTEPTDAKKLILNGLWEGFAC